MNAEQHSKGKLKAYSFLSGSSGACGGERPVHVPFLWVMPALIRVQDVWKTYQVGDQQVHALRGLSMDVEKGEYTALMGPSGSGKSTLMNMLGCLDTPTSGKYHLAGEDVGTLDDDALADIRNRRIGFVFQTFNLMPRYTALENVALPMVYAGLWTAERTARAQEVLHQVGISLLII